MGVGAGRFLLTTDESKAVDVVVCGAWDDKSEDNAFVLCRLCPEGVSVVDEAPDNVTPIFFFVEVLPPAIVVAGVVKMLTCVFSLRAC